MYSYVYKHVCTWISAPVVHVQMLHQINFQIYYKYHKTETQLWFGYYDPLSLQNR